MDSKLYGYAIARRCFVCGVKNDLGANSVEHSLKSFDANLRLGLFYRTLSSGVERALGRGEACLCSSNVDVVKLDGLNSRDISDRVGVGKSEATRHEKLLGVLVILFVMNFYNACLKLCDGRGVASGNTVLARCTRDNYEVHGLGLVDGFMREGEVKYHISPGHSSRLIRASDATAVERAASYLGESATGCEHRARSCSSGGRLTAPHRCAGAVRRSSGDTVGRCAALAATDGPASIDCWLIPAVRPLPASHSHLLSLRATPRPHLARRLISSRRRP